MISIKIDSQTGLTNLAELAKFVDAPAHKSPGSWFKSCRGAKPLITLFGDIKECYIDVGGKKLPKDISVIEPLALAYAKFVSVNAYYRVWNEYRKQQIVQRGY